MNRTLKLITVGALGAWLLATTGCEDKVCQQQLQSYKKDSESQRKECAANLTKIQDLKTQLADAQSKVDTLTKENDELKNNAQAAASKPKGKGKAAKGKHKKRGKK